ncbi:MAG: leucine-rich repeat protein [Lachnospiraceae bacterium]|nr:leucine-rich repeat protein [Lachnospiraceae bacterium]
MKKAILFGLVVGMCLLFSACGNKEEMAAYEATIEALIEQTEDFQNQIEQLESKELDLQKQLGELQNEADQYKKQLDDLLEEKEAWGTEQENYVQEIASLKEDNNNLLGTMQELQGQLDTKEEDEEPENVIPEGAVFTIPAEGTYIRKSTNENLTEGTQIYASQMEYGDRLFLGDYCYTFAETEAGDGWKVAVTSKTQTEYGEMQAPFGIAVLSMDSAFAGCENMTKAPEIPNTVRNLESAYIGCTSLVEAPIIPEGITSMVRTFWECTALETVPVIPEGVTDLQATFQDCTAMKIAPVLPSTITYMAETFLGCSSLETPPNIPEGVKSIQYAFAQCSSLKQAPVIPSSVLDLRSAFAGCYALTGEIEIHANPTLWSGCFNFVDFEKQGITLTGSSIMLESIAEN